jgi:hypothetical protein
MRTENGSWKGLSASSRREIFFLQNTRRGCVFFYCLGRCATKSNKQPFSSSLFFRASCPATISATSAALATQNAAKRI